MKRALALLLLVLLAGCDEDMDQQNRTKTYGSSQGLFHWPGKGEALPLPPGTVAQGNAARERAEAEPPPVTLALIERGQERYQIYCAACHGLTGAGDGVVVHHGFPAPAAFSEAKPMATSARAMMDAIDHGTGTMYGFADRVSPADQWAVVAYIRALQLAGAKK